MKKYFGTDGIRGVANADSGHGLTPEFALQLGQAAGAWLKESGRTPRVVLGRDTRRSGPMLEGALAAGFNSAGVSVVSVGVAPTPAVAFLARTQAFGLGGIISASHNPAEDNGIKFVDHEGRKLLDSNEETIESLLGCLESRPTHSGVGSYSREPELLESYLQFLETLVPEGLSGLDVAVDAAHGAAYLLGPAILARLGAQIKISGHLPDGLNINAEGGATKPATICELTRASGCNVGVAFDGDADRAVFSDSEGRLINGDRMMAIWAASHQSEGKLDPPAVVGTVMSNGGFAAYLEQQGIDLHRAPVGDKYVSEKLVELRAMIGGEQSGHIVFPTHGPTGDGIATMLEFFRVLKRSGKTAAEWFNAYQPWPQILYNLKVENPRTFSSHRSVVTTIESLESELGNSGRVNVRASGTQPVLRVMVEASSERKRDEVATRIVEAILESMGGTIEGRVDLTYSLGD